MLKIGLVLCNMFTLECESHWLTPVEMTLEECEATAKVLLTSIITSSDTLNHGAYICSKLEGVDT